MRVIVHPLACRVVLRPTIPLAVWRFLPLVDLRPCLAPSLDAPPGPPTAAAQPFLSAMTSPLFKDDADERAEVLIGRYVRFTLYLLIGELHGVILSQAVSGRNGLPVGVHEHLI